MNERPSNDRDADLATQPILTTQQGAPVPDDHHSQKVGPRGPVLLDDHVLREKLMHFDHERIPERVVHPRGSGAHGHFQVYEPMAEYTTAAFLQDPSVRTPVFVRFSTVVGFRGSADTVRDVRGFATKFYTSDGNYDLVGNNMPVFFIQDAIKFPDLVHAIKPEPHHEMPQASAAHDNFWDFVSLMPESMHMILWVLSDRGIPRSYRMMEGFGVHTFRFVDAEGRSRFVKFHWKPLLGTHSLVWPEAQMLAGKDPDFHRRDLWEAIESGDHPQFELGVQIIEEDEVDRFDFDLFDATKLVPEELVPVRPIGMMTLDRNPDNFFAETEQVAFHPGHLVPGIDVTPDPLLQGRLFSYLDTQLLRLGGPNFTEIPINRPHVEVHNHQQDGLMRQRIDKGRVNYEPSSLGGGCPVQAGHTWQSLRAVPDMLEGRRGRERGDSFADHFTQATLFWNSQSETEREHVIAAGRFELGMVEHRHVRQRVVDLLHHVDPELARRVADGVGITDVTGDLSYLEDSTAPRPNERRGAAAPGRSAALSMEGGPRSARGRKVAVLAAEGVDAGLLSAAREALQGAGVTTLVVAAHLGDLAHGSGGDEAVLATKTFSTGASVMFDGILVAAGSGGALAASADAMRFVAEAYAHAKPVGAMGDGAEVLRAAGIPGVDDGSVPGVVRADDGDATGFAAAFEDALAAHRHWQRPPATVSTH